jgi:hypothetical protein
MAQIAPPVYRLKTLCMGSFYAGSATVPRCLPLTLGAGPAAPLGVASPNTRRRMTTGPTGLRSDR